MERQTNSIIVINGNASTTDSSSSSFTLHFSLLYFISFYSLFDFHSTCTYGVSFVVGFAISLSLSCHRLAKHACRFVWFHHQLRKKSRILPTFYRLAKHCCCFKRKKALSPFLSPFFKSLFVSVCHWKEHFMVRTLSKISSSGKFFLFFVSMFARSFFAMQRAKVHRQRGRENEQLVSLFFSLRFLSTINCKMNTNTYTHSTSKERVICDSTF